MKFLLTFLVISLVIFSAPYSFGQVKPAFLQIKFEKPNVSYIPLVDWENYERMSRTQKIDNEGFLKVSIPIERSQVVYINYLDSSNIIHIYQFFLPKNDTLRCIEHDGEFTFEGTGKAAETNRFLYRIGILGEDTLRQKPLMRKVADDLYANFMRDIADEKWHLYQTTQDTTDNTQNVFVKAALEAQQFFRTQFFLQTKDWTDEMFNNIKNKIMGANRFMPPNYEITYRPPFRIVQHEEAILSRDYQFSLMSHLGGNIYSRQKSNLSEKIGEFYDAVDRELSRLPQTREALVSTIFRNNWFNDSGSQGLLERFERDFPKSKHLKEVRYANWSMQNAKAGSSIPPVPLLKSDSTQTNLQMSKGAPTLVLIWNTWEDSCQTALSSVAAIAKKQEKSGVRFMTICVRNRFESWKEVLMCHWPNSQKDTHFYADYPETAVLEGIFTKKRPKLVVIDKEGNYVEELSPFETAKIEKWFKK